MPKNQGRNPSPKPEMCLACSPEFQSGARMRATA
jgi:hypothetical protein